MMWRSLVISLGIFFGIAVMAQERSTDLDGKFLALSDQFVKESLARSPVSASGAGYHTHPGPGGKPIELDAQIDDLSPAAYDSQRRFFQDWRARFTRETPSEKLSVDGRADWALLQDQIS